MSRWTTTMERISKHEGFEGYCYEDYLGNETIGKGTLLPLTEREADMLLKHRLKQKEQKLLNELPASIWNKLSKIRKGVLLEMAYQLGVGGLMKFDKFFQAIMEGNWSAAADQMLDSKWYEQTPERAKELSLIFENNTWEVAA